MFCVQRQIHIRMIYDLKFAIDRQRAEKRFVQLMAESVKIELKKKVKRSLSQNSYLHVIIGFFAIETGYTTTESKQIYKECTPQVYEYEKDNKKFIRSSAELSTSEMSITINRFRDYSSMEAGVYLPSADEKQFLEECEREIQRNRYI